MKPKTMIHKSVFHRTAFLLAAAALALCLSAAAQTETVLHNFTGAPDGSTPAPPVPLDGKFYGITQFGGASSNGAVYAMTPESNGSFDVSVVYSFAGGSEGQYPVGKLIADSAGNLYGVTVFGGNQNQGIAYELSKTASGSWDLTVLWAFGNPGDAANPFAGLTWDKSGNLFGTTSVGGSYGTGTVFELSPSSGGGWTEQVLYSFGGYASDGTYPVASVIFDAAGNLYSTTESGGDNSCDYFTLGCGTVFELSPGASGWTETIIHYFDNNGRDGFYTSAPLIIEHGALYGTTQYGGGSVRCQRGFRTLGCGTVFKLTNVSGSWGEDILYAFNKSQGVYQPDSGLTFDNTGNLYGETASNSLTDGTVYRLSPSASGAWTLANLVTFTGSNGNNPAGGLSFGDGGNLFGATTEGGTDNFGVVFELTP